MKKFYLQLFIAMISLAGYTTVMGQAGSVSLIPPTGSPVSYASITAAYNAIPNPLTGNYRIELQATYAGTDVSEVYPITFTDKGLAPGGFTITVRPAAGANAKVIQRVTPLAGATILFDGGDNIILDGRPGGVVSSSANYLTVNDAFVGSASSRAIELFNGANNNTIQYINAIAAPSNSAGSGARVINISTSATVGSNNNTITNNIVTGGLRGIQIFGTVANNTGTIITNNTVRDFGAIGIFGGSFQDNTTIQSNTITFTTLPQTAGAIAGIQNQGTTTVTNILDNTISIPLSASIVVTGVTGIVNVGTGTVNILRNTISNLSTTGPTTATSTSIQGIASSPATAAGTINISRNKISNLTSPGPGNIRGIAIFEFSGTVVNVNNNFVSIMDANPTAIAIFGMLIGANGTTNPFTSNIYFNTVKIGGTQTTGTTGLSSYGIYRSDNTAASVLNLKNNIGITERTGGPTLTIGFYNPNNTLGTMNVDYNVWYGSAGGAGNSYAAGWAGTAYDNTGLADYKTAATPNEANTRFMNVNFVSNTDLHLAGASITDANLYGTPIAGITTDIDGQTRSTTNPFRGGDEYGAPVPVTLMNFNVKKSGTVNLLNWSTAQEINSNKYIIERSNDGTNFTAIGQVAAAGNSSNARSYAFTDNSPLKGMNFYRLRIVDIDLSVKFSDIRSIRNAENATFTIYPNPAQDYINLELDAVTDGMAKIVVNDINGKEVMAKQANLTPGYNVTTLDVNNLPQGTYFIRVQFGEYSVVNKFTKL